MALEWLDAARYADSNGFQFDGETDQWVWRDWVVKALNEDMPFDQFGEGSFDKGIRITIPYDYFIGTPTQKKTSTVLQSLARDGGARVQVDGRLYETVRSGQLNDLRDTWGRFWR